MHHLWVIFWCTSYIHIFVPMSSLQPFWHVVTFTDSRGRGVVGKSPVYSHNFALLSWISYIWFCISSYWNNRSFRSKFCWAYSQQTGIWENFHFPEAWNPPETYDTGILVSDLFWPRKEKKNKFVILLPVNLPGWHSTYYSLNINSSIVKGLELAFPP